MTGYLLVSVFHNEGRIFDRIVQGTGKHVLVGTVDLFHQDDPSAFITFQKIRFRKCKFPFHDLILSLDLIRLRIFVELGLVKRQPRGG